MRSSLVETDLSRFTQPVRIDYTKSNKKIEQLSKQNKTLHTKIGAFEGLINSAMERMQELDRNIKDTRMHTFRSVQALTVCENFGNTVAATN